MWYTQKVPAICPQISSALVMLGVVGFEFLAAVVVMKGSVFWDTTLWSTET
jgi:hypothetical protein